MSALATSRASFTLPVDPLQRFALLHSMVGSFIRLTSGDFSIEGTLVAVVRPARASDSEDPIMVMSVNGERIMGPVLPGDVVS